MSSNDASATNPEPPGVSRAEVQDLLSFLAANVDVARADGKQDKAGRFQSLLATAKRLVLSAESVGAVN